MPPFVWIAFLLLIGGLVALDLGVFHRRPRVVTVGQALAWTIFWVGLALLFNVAIYWLYEAGHVVQRGLGSSELTGQQAALQFFTGYVLEKSLSLDNIFVIAMIFAYFQVPPVHQHRLLFWGVLGAVVLRGVMIGIGTVLIHRFEWITYVFGALLLASAVRMLVLRHDNLEPDRNLMVRLVRRFYPVSTSSRDSFFVGLEDGRTAVTPLFLALILVEASDVMFAVDSIPAIFAVTRDPFLVFTSNIFAILGLRSLYFALAGLIDRFRYMKSSLVFLLAYIGVKMLLIHYYPIPNLISLAIIGGILFVGVAASVIAGGRDTAKLVSPLGSQIERMAAITYRQGRRLVILLLGISVILVGIAMIVLPGPALIVIPLGLAILSLEFAWARRWLQQLRTQASRFRQRIGPTNGSTG